MVLNCLNVVFKEFSDEIKNINISEKILEIPVCDKDIGKLNHFIDITEHKFFFKKIKLFASLIFCERVHKIKEGKHQEDFQDLYLILNQICLYPHVLQFSLHLIKC